VLEKSHHKERGGAIEWIVGSLPKLHKTNTLAMLDFH
jgi:hypothetical protein